jgi:hypothetical protein
MKPKQTAGLACTQAFLHLPLLEKIKLSLKEVTGYENEGWQRRTKSSNKEN